MLLIFMFLFFFFFFKQKTAYEIVSGDWSSDVCSSDLTTAEATRAVGGLLILGLVAAPAGMAHRLTTRPYTAMVLSAGAATFAMWAGLIISYEAPQVPPSFAILAVATAGYALVALVAAWGERSARVSRSPSRLGLGSESGML